MCKGGWWLWLVMAMDGSTHLVTGEATDGCHLSQLRSTVLLGGDVRTSMRLARHLLTVAVSNALFTSLTVSCCRCNDAARTPCFGLLRFFAISLKVARQLT